MTSLRYKIVLYTLTESVNWSINFYQLANYMAKYSYPHSHTMLNVTRDIVIDLRIYDIVLLLDNEFNCSHC